MLEISSNLFHSLIFIFFETFSTVFTRLKPARSIYWDHSLGSVDIVVHLQDRTISQTALPIQALVLQEFSEMQEISEAYLSDKFGMDVDRIKDICKFWERKGVLSNFENTWKVLETRKDLIHGNTYIYIYIVEDEDHYSDPIDAENDLSPLIPFITGMLTNLGPLDIQTMHSTLSMLNIASFTVVELSDFLEKTDFVQTRGSKFVLKS